MQEKAAQYDESYTNYQARRSRLRKLIRRLYLRHTLRYVKGKTIDFGCGIGELLERLPHGSVGFEVNEATVRYCTTRGLTVRLYDPGIDGYRFSGVPAGVFTTFVMSHVLEHLDDPGGVLRTVLGSCSRLGIQRIIIIVPGLKGFRFDKTHKTFVDRDFFETNRLEDVLGYRIADANCFPFPCSWMGNFFTYNELTVVYDRTHS